MADQPDVVEGWVRYNETPWGRLRLDLIRWHLDRWLSAAPMRVLDAGCGTGETASWLATRANQVLAVDRSDAMLAVARDRANGDLADVEWAAAEVPDDLPDGPFGLIVCHNVLGYLPEPAVVCERMAGLLVPGGYLSVVVSNAVALPLQIAARDGDLRGALRAARGERTRNSAVCDDILVAYTPGEVRGWLGDAGLRVLRQGGIRTVNDYLPNALKTDDNYPDVLALEQELSEQAPYNEIGSLVHILAQRP